MGKGAGAVVGGLIGYKAGKDDQKTAQRLNDMQTANSPFLLAKPYISQAYDESQAFYNGDKQEFSQGTLAAYKALKDRALSGNEGTNQANDMLTATLRGDYLNSNPYLDGVIQRALDPVANSVNSAFSMGGRYGSGQNAKVLSQSLADTAGNISYQNYSDERARQLSAVPMAQQLALQDYYDIEQLIKANSIDDPSGKLDRYLNRINMLPNSPTQLNPVMAGSPWGSALGGAAVGAGIGSQFDQPPQK